MKKLLLLVAATLSTAVYAEEIDGIFGFRFGEVFNMQRQDYEITEDDEVFSVFLENNIKKERISYLLTLNPYDFKIARIAGLEYSLGIDKSGCINGKESYEKSFKKDIIQV